MRSSQNFIRLFFVQYIKLRTGTRNSTVCTVRYTNMQKMRFANTIVHTKLLKRTETRRQGAEGAAVAEFSASF